MCETWNNGFRHLVGHAHPSLWTVIACLQKDNAGTETEVYLHEQGHQAAKRRKKTVVAHQQRLKGLCKDFHHGNKDVREFLMAIGKCVRLDH